MDANSILCLKVADLRQKLSELKLLTSGRKSVLQDRLLDHYGISADDVESAEKEEEEETVVSEGSLEIPNKIQTFTLNDVRETISVFYGTGQPQIEQWIQEFEENATIVMWSNVQKFIYAKQLLRGASQLWLRGQRNINSWEKLKHSLLEEFGNKLSVADIHKQLANAKKKANESNLEFLYKIIELAKPLELAEESVIEYFIEGIWDSRRNKATLYEAKTIDDLKQKIKIYEKIKTQYYRPSGFETNKKYTNNFEKKCEFCPHLSNHSSEECRKANNTCFNCNKKGHRASDCRMKNANQETRGRQFHNKQQQSYRNTEDRNSSNITNRQINNNNNANDLNLHRQNAGNANNQNRPTLRTNFSFMPENIYKKVKIRNVEFNALLDTGSDLTLITKSIFEAIGESILFPNTFQIHGVGQGMFQTLGYILTKASIDGIEFNWYFHVAEDADIHSQPLLGCDLLKILNINLAKGSATIWVKEKQKSLESLLFDEMLGTQREECVDKFIAGHEFRAICEDNQIDNTIEFGPFIANITNAERTELTKLITRYKPNKTECVNVETKIILTDDIPVCHKRRKYSLQEEKFIEKQVEEWIEEGIITPSFSEYTSPVVLVSKPNGTKRLCCDYRKINEKTVRDNYPMVLIDDVLMKLQNAKIFTTLDLKNGYFHVPVEKNSQKYTAFATSCGQFEFLKTPFGLTNAPAVFCRFVSAIFHEYIQDGTMIMYMDDIIIPSQTTHENIEKLSKVLQQAAKYGLEINFGKCQFVQTQVLFLGYIIENSTIQPSQNKTKAVKNFKEPTDVKSLQRFLGLTSYFRRFIKNYTYIAKPLTALLTSKIKFKFNSEEKIAFETLKMALATAPVLKIFNPQALTEIHTDASSYGYGAALLQKDNEDMQWHPVEYMSRKTTNLEAKYHSYELEVLAIINALKKWRCYVMGLHIKIVTDCHAFTQTVKKREVPARIARWIIFLQEFDYEIEHRGATRLKHVDALSRVHTLLIQSSLKHCIIKAQKEDDWIKAIREILTKGNYEDFYLKNDMVYKNPTKELIVIPSKMEREIIEHSHKQGHVSIKKTIDIVQKDFYIRDITNKTTTVVKNCVQCIVSNAKAGKKEGLLNPIDKSDKPLETYHIDHVGPLERTAKQYNYILVLVDAFSKFTWLYPTKSTGSNEVINALQKQSAIFGNPSRIISDRGSSFTSQAFQDYCREENIIHHTVTTGVPRGNGQVERIHKIIISLLTKLCVEKPQNWYRFTDRIQKTLNNTVNRSTKATPFKILTGIEMNVNGLDEIKKLLNEEEIKELEENRDDIRKEACKNILQIQQENRENYNKKRKTEMDYQLGDLVAIKRTQFGTGLKIKPDYLGPYKITKIKRLGRYEVEKLDETEGPKRTTTIAEYMKPWRKFEANLTSE